MGIGNILKGKNLDTTSGAAKVTVIGNNSQFTGNITFTGTLKYQEQLKVILRLPKIPRHNLY